MAVYDPDKISEQRAKAYFLGKQALMDGFASCESLHKKCVHGTKAEEFIASVNWRLLKEQYEELASWKEQQALDFKGAASWASQKSHEYHEKQQAMLEGTLALLDGLKDLAVDHFGIDTITVFGEEQW